MLKVAVGDVESFQIVTNSVSSSPDLKDLPLKNRVAIILHEVGHLMHPDGEEPGADMYIKSTFGIHIDYSGPLELQIISKADLDRILEGKDYV